ncbi:glycosyltransferase family 4 protein [Microbacterium sp.]|uniref:glycosyltransferase family 4 protein n=1 Tax=Microbacterium sp. TaxID=51671 RepID=UPI0028114ACF|nr:glycosyltransferase family 4 protein [Microbacterium sp.]
MAVRSATRVLVIANAYPSDRALYRNGFIHRRVKAYQEAGLEVEVFYHHQPVAELQHYVYDDVPVTVGRSEHLEALAKSARYDAYLVHFAEPGRLVPLMNAAVSAPVIVWIHGFEAEAWHRRWFNFVLGSTEIADAIAKKSNYYETQNRFLRDLVVERPLRLRFVNVSAWFQHMIVEPDIDAEITDGVVIPNLIDEELFQYRAKSPALRLRILSVRPYASRKYANDVMVAAILELSKRPYFDELLFTICGEGVLFEKITAPLHAFPNVELHNRFFSQEEIVELHADHGVFLAPTRFDSQGVSMCEAASSGLVAVATDVTAVPEFVKNRVSGLLVPPESPVALADAIEELYFDEELFLTLSEEGSRSMTARCGRRATVDKEIALIRQEVAR